MTWILTPAIAGNPFRWLDVERATLYGAKGEAAGDRRR